MKKIQRTCAHGDRRFLPATVLIALGLLLAVLATSAKAGVQRLPNIPGQGYGGESHVVNGIYPPVSPAWPTSPAASWAAAQTTPQNGVWPSYGHIPPLMTNVSPLPTGSGTAPPMQAPPPTQSPVAYWQMAAAPQSEPVRVAARPCRRSCPQPWCLQIAPDGLIYRSYLAGAKEPRFASQWVHDASTDGWLWDVTLGGRVGILRYGTACPDHPEGWQLDIEGAAFPQLDLDNSRDLVACDYRFGIPLTYGRGRYQTKLAYYHLSSHLGDEYMERNPGAVRINFVRDALVWGHSFYLIDDLRLYGEAGWAFYTDGGSEPWEFQFGVEYSPVAPRGLRGAPFWAIGGHLREEVDFGGNLVVQVGWQWRGLSGHLLRTGLHYYTGHNDQYQFFNDDVDKLGFGIWYDY